MGRSPCCSKEEGLNRGAWTAHEDKILTDYITLHGEGRWRNLPKRAGLKRCGKSCRLRWLNYLRPDIKRGNITPDEEELIIRLHKLLGNRWSLIAGRLPGRTDNEIKNYWNTNLGKKVHKHTNIQAQAQPTQHVLEHEQYEKAAHHSNSPPSVPVVRTKATKCSKLFINPLLHPISSPQLHKAKPYNDYGLTTSFEGITDQEDLLLGDFNVGELCLSDLLNSDSFSLSPSSCDQPFVFSDEILHDWTHTNAAQPPLHNNLHSFTSFLHSTHSHQCLPQ